MTFLLFLAKRYVVSFEKKSLRSFVLVISAAGIFLASAFVLVSLGILAGFQQTYQKAILDFNAHLIVYREGNIFQEDQLRLESFFNTQKQLSYSPYLFYETLMPTNKGMKPVVFKGVKLDQLTKVYPLNITYFIGPRADEKSAIFVGSDLLKFQPDALESHKIKVLSLKDKQGNPQTRYESIPIAGSFSSGLYDFDSQFILMDLAALQEKYFDHNTVSGFEIHLNDLNDLDDVIKKLQANFKDDFQFLTWQELNESLLTALKRERSNVFAIAFLVLMIACLNIFGFNFLFFVERKKDFMIFSSLGMGRRQLQNLLALLSFAIGGLATLLGAGLSWVILMYLSYGKGIPLDPQIYFVSRIPVSLNASWFVIFVVSALLLCYLTSLIAGRVVLKRHMAAELTTT